MTDSTRLLKFAGTWRKVGGNGPEMIDVTVHNRSTVLVKSARASFDFKGIGEAKNNSATFTGDELVTSDRTSQRHLERALKLTGGSLVLTERTSHRSTTISGQSAAYEKAT